MSNISAGSNQPLVQNTAKVETVEKKTMLDKGVEAIKEKTAKGTLVGDHYAAAGALGLVGGIAAVAGVGKLADQVPLIKQGVNVVLSKGTGGALGLAASVVLSEDAVHSIKEGKSIKGGAEALGAAITGLGGVELVGKQFNIPYARQAFTATGEFLGKNSQAIVGGGSAIGGVVSVASGISDLRDGKKLKGAAKIAGGAVGTLGGAELVGRQFNIPVMKEALTGPIKAVFSSGKGLAVVGGAVGLTGAGAGVDGVRRLSTGKGILNDAIGTAEVTAATTAVTGGATLIGMATGNEALKKALPENSEIIGAVALGAGAVGLGKYSANSMKQKGVTILNATTATGAGLAALGAVEIAGSKLGIPLAKEAFQKGWQPVLAVGLGAASYKMGANAVREVKGGNAINALGQGAGAIVLGSSSVALVGNAFKIPGLEKVGEKMLEGASDIASPIVQTAVKNPGLTLGAVAVVSAVGVYAYYNKHNEKAASK